MGRAGGWILGVALLVGACGAAGPSGALGGSVVGPSGTPGLVLPLKGTALAGDLEPGGLDANRLAFTDKQGVGVINLDTGEVTRLPAAPRGLAFRPTSLGGNVITGEVTGALRNDPLATEAMAFDLAAAAWVDVAGLLPSGHASTATATDGDTIVGMDLGAPGAKALARAYVYDVASSTVTDLVAPPGVPVPRPRAVGGGRIAGSDDAATAGNGWLWDLAAGGYTMLDGPARSSLAVPYAVTDDTVVGSLGGKAGSGITPFVYDAGTKVLTSLPMPGSIARDVSASGVLLVADAGWNGWIRNLATGAQVAFDKVMVSGSPVAIRPWALSDGWVVGLTAPPQGSSAAFGEVVVIDIGEGP
jgi:hypothetical protein